LFVSFDKKEQVVHVQLRQDAHHRGLGREAHLDADSRLSLSH
jgi:hypothetical protein